MKTARKAGHDATTPLPPAPAPPSHDANPWPMPDSGTQPVAPRERNMLARLVPALIAAGVIGATVINLIESANGGDAVEALIPLAFVLVFGVMMLRRALRRRDRD